MDLKYKLIVTSVAAGLLFGCGSTSTPSTKLESVPSVSDTLIDEANKKGLKRVVAIARFTNETKSGTGFFVDQNNDRIGKQASDILSARLAATGKFIMLERADLDKIVAEGDFSGVANQKIPADYLIVGSVSEFGRKTESDVGVFSRSKKQIATATVNIRLIDTQTGQIIYSEEASGESTTEANTTLGLGGRAGYDSSLNDAAISAAISKMTSDVVENLLDKPWRAYLLDIQDGMYVLSGGESQGITAGDTFDLLKRGKTVKNPQSGIEIELPGKKVGELTIVTTLGQGNNEISMAELDGLALQKETLSDYYVAEQE